MTLVFLALFGAINAAIAKRKGYNAVIWFFAAGAIGLIFILFLPDTNNEKYNPEKAKDWVGIGNKIGGSIVCIAVIFFIFLIWIA